MPRRLRPGPSADSVASMTTLPLFWLHVVSAHASAIFEAVGPELEGARVLGDVAYLVIGVPVCLARRDLDPDLQINAIRGSQMLNDLLRQPRELSRVPFRIDPYHAEEPAVLRAGWSRVRTADRSTCAGVIDPVTVPASRLSGGSARAS